ncbi:hypothetical protein D9615_003645 [Tricholomella constricta]|uniref:Uncharacterized protein n=1 Tax=Tricholomella constricta TaxID=117010 RepID=A0A8H5M7K1_9AGAR|nr:hypothetical protein D9615_003645 [Tricholomella constricta]
MVRYKQSFWAIDIGTGDIGATKRAQIAKAAYTMNDHPDIIFATSCGGRSAAQLEVAFITLIPHDTEALRPHLLQALSDHGLSVGIRLKDEIRHYDFGQLELERIANSSKAESREQAYKMIDELAALPLHTESVPTKPAIAFPPQYLGDLFSVNQNTFTRLRDARGPDIEYAIRNLNNAFIALEHETNSNAMVAIMVANGLVTIGGAMWKAYNAVKSAGSLSLLISGILEVAGGVVAVTGIVAAIAAVFILVFWVLKDEINVLLFANDAGVSYNLTDDYILHGERKSVVADLPHAPPPSTSIPRAYPSGL